MEVSIKEYFDHRCDSIITHFNSLLAERGKGAEREIRVLDERLGKMNEIRAQLTDQYGEFNHQMGKYLTRDEYNGKHESVLTDIRKIEDMFRQYTSIVEFQAIRLEVKVLNEWKANMAGRLWTLGIGLGLFQVLLTLFRWAATSNVTLH